jgi:hypothetical protein
MGPGSIDDRRGREGSIGSRELDAGAGDGGLLRIEDANGQITGKRGEGKEKHGQENRTTHG